MNATGGSYNTGVADGAKAATVEQTWLLLTAIGVLTMQAGFALLESGSVRSKHTQSILLKNLADYASGAIAWYVSGYGLFGPNSNHLFVGTAGFFVSDSADFALFFQSYAYAVAAGTIVSGAVVGRMHFKSYIVVASFVVGVVHPIVAHWAWAGREHDAESERGGWLARLGYVDFAGSAVIHCVGGCVALMGAWIVGPRHARFLDCGEGKVGSADPNRHDHTAARAAVNTLLGSASACVGGLIFGQRGDKFNLGLCLNTLLAGLVCVTASCGTIEPWGAIISGLLASVVYVWAQNIVLYRWHIDDAINAFAVHGACGFLGTVLEGIFNAERGLIRGRADHLLVQLAGSASIAAFAFACAGLVFALQIKLSGSPRLALQQQMLGLDAVFCLGDDDTSGAVAESVDFSKYNEWMWRGVVKASSYVPRKERLSLTGGKLSARGLLRRLSSTTAVLKAPEGAGVANDGDQGAPPSSPPEGGSYKYASMKVQARRPSELLAEMNDIVRIRPEHVTLSERKPIRGGEGVVTQGAYRGKLVAVKTAKNNRSAKEALLGEIATLKHLSHRNIVFMYGVIAEPLSIVMDWASRGSLRDLVYDPKVFISPRLCGRIIYQVASAMKYVHFKQFLYLDLKTDNVLVNNPWKCLLCDFGTTSRVSEIAGSLGTQHWVAPEMIRGDEFSYSADVYSFGILLCEMLRRSKPVKAPAFIYVR